MIIEPFPGLSFAGWSLNLEVLGVPSPRGPPTIVCLVLDGPASPPPSLSRSCPFCMPTPSPSRPSVGSTCTEGTGPATPPPGKEYMEKRSLYIFVSPLCPTADAYEAGPEASNRAVVRRMATLRRRQGKKPAADEEGQTNNRPESGGVQRCVVGKQHCFVYACVSSTPVYTLSLLRRASDVSERSNDGQRRCLCLACQASEQFAHHPPGPRSEQGGIVWFFDLPSVICLQFVGPQKARGGGKPSPAAELRSLEEGVVHCDHQEVAVFAACLGHFHPALWP